MGRRRERITGGESRDATQEEQVDVWSMYLDYVVARTGDPDDYANDPCGIALADLRSWREAVQSRLDQYTEPPSAARPWRALRLDPGDEGPPLDEDLDWTKP